jgi:hypothetical protein
MPAAAIQHFGELGFAIASEGFHPLRSILAEEPQKWPLKRHSLRNDGISVVGHAFGEIVHLRRSTKVSYSSWQ